MNLTRVARAAVAALMLAACMKHEERDITPWLKVDVRTPHGGTSGVIRLGSNEQVWYAKIGGRWIRLGKGNYSSYFVLGDDETVLFDLGDQSGLRVARAGVKPERFTDVFGSGQFFVLPNAEAIDVLECRVPAKVNGCREATISRYDIAGKPLQTFEVALPEAYSDCGLSSIRGYDIDRIPYVVAQCKFNSEQAKCVVQAPRDSGPFLHVVGTDQPWSECSEFRKMGVSMTFPRTGTVIN